MSAQQIQIIINGSLKNWKDVSSVVPRASVLASVLFIIFINNMDDWIESRL